MKIPRVFAATVVLALASVAACNRAETSRDAEHAKEQMKSAANQAKRAATQAGEKRADSWLTSKIQAQFFADDDIKSRYINVGSRDGVVTLKGFVESDDARRQVLEITRNTDGVKQIDDHQLLVGRPAHESFDSAAATSLPEPVATGGVAPASGTLDSAAMTMIQARYFMDPAIKARNIDVQVANGVVTLKGSVGSETERQQALLLARSAAGVQRVEDYLTVDAGLQ